MWKGLKILVSLVRPDSYRDQLVPIKTYSIVN
jgi:hypothetical protein